MERSRWHTFSNLSKDEAVELGSVVGALVGLGIEGEEGMFDGAEAGAEAGAGGVDENSRREGLGCPRGHPERLGRCAGAARAHTTGRCRCATQSLARADSLLSDGFISPLDLVEIGLVAREEADELHALEASRQAA